MTCDIYYYLLFKYLISLLQKYIAGSPHWLRKAGDHTWNLGFFTLFTCRCDDSVPTQHTGDDMGVDLFMRENEKDNNVENDQCDSWTKVVNVWKLLSGSSSVCVAAWRSHTDSSWGQPEPTEPEQGIKQLKWVCQVTSADLINKPSTRPLLTRHLSVRHLFTAAHQTYRCAQRWAVIGRAEGVGEHRRTVAVWHLMRHFLDWFESFPCAHTLLRRCYKLPRTHKFCHDTHTLSSVWSCSTAESWLDIVSVTSLYERQ